MNAEDYDIIFEKKCEIAEARRYFADMKTEQQESQQ